MNQNHSIDPTYFYDAIEEFSFNYNIYIVKENEPDDYGRINTIYEQNTIRGSLQSKGKSQNQSKKGNTETFNYNFYCKSLYRIDIGDIIEYKGNYLRVYSVQDYDEYGVREASLSMIDLTSYRDFADYISYLKGEKLV